MHGRSNHFSRERADKLQSFHRMDWIPFMVAVHEYFNDRFA